MTDHIQLHPADADQEIPWADQPLEYYKKFRIYFQELNASFHRQIYRQDWGIGADQDYAEYDVVQCGPGTPVGQCTQTIEGTWMPVPPSQPNVYLVKARSRWHHACTRRYMVPYPQATRVARAGALPLPRAHVS